MAHTAGALNSNQTRARASWQQISELQTKIVGTKAIT